MYTVDKKIEVRYAETDQMGVVYHANYLVWMEIGRTAFIESLGFTYKEMEDAGILSPVSKVILNYKKPAKYGDTVTVRTWITKVSQFRSIYQTLVLDSQGDICLEATCEAACVNAEDFTLVSFKKTFPEMYEAYRGVVVKE